jgi:hypothetical protein
MEMVHHQDVVVELSTRLLTAQHEIETLRAQLRNADATIRGYMRMDGRGSGQRALRIRHRHLDSHLFGPEFGQGACSGQPLPLQISQSLGVTRVCNNVVLVIACLMIDVCACEC